MKIKRILLTGASGKIGRAVLPELLARGYHVRCMELPEEPIPVPGDYERIVGNLADEALVEKTVTGMDAVIHLANVKENRALFLDTNIKGTFYLLDAARRHELRQFIQAGSDARAGIYYHPRPFPIAETFPHAGYPGYYPLSKVLEETMGEQFFIQYQFPVTMLRFSWVFAEDDILVHMLLAGPGFGVPVWRELALTPAQKRCFETGANAVACMTHVGGKPALRHIVGLADVVQAVLLALGNPVTLGEAFNVSGPAPFSYRVAADYIGRQLALPVVEFENPVYHDFCIDLTKSRGVLGYQPQHDIFRIIDDALAFRRSGRQRSRMLYPG